MFDERKGKRKVEYINQNINWFLPVLAMVFLLLMIMVAKMTLDDPIMKTPSITIYVGVEEMEGVDPGVFCAELRREIGEYHGVEIKVVPGMVTSGTGRNIHSSQTDHIFMNAFMKIPLVADRLRNRS